MRSERCVKCGGGMEEGFLIDSRQNAVRVAQWAHGAPEYWLLKILKMRGRRRLRVETRRCTKCGYLESFATEPAA